MLKNLLTRLSLTKEGKLMRAALKGQIHKVYALIQAGVDPNSATKNGYTSLMGAALEGHKEVVKLLLQSGADPNIRYSDGRTALLGAVHNGHAEVVKILLKSGADPNIKEKTQNQTPLFFAVEKNHPEIIKLLIKGGANLEAKEKVGQYTPLFFAVIRYHIEAIRILLQAGANPFALGNEGESVSELAEDLQNTEIVKMFYNSIESSNFERPQKFKDYKKLQQLISEKKVRILIDSDLPINTPLSLYSFDKQFSKKNIWLQVSGSGLTIKYPEPWENILSKC